MGRIHTAAAAPFVDLSETGALLEVETSLRPGAFYTLRFTLPQGPPLTLKARVVRSYVSGFMSGPGGEGVVLYRTAVEFVETAEADRAAILRHLETGGPLPAAGIDGFDEDFEDKPS